MTTRTPPLSLVDPDKTPPGGIDTPRAPELGTFEQRIEGRLASVEDKLDALIKDRREDALLALRGLRHCNDSIAELRAGRDADREGDGLVLAWMSDADRRIKALERGSLTNEVALDAVQALTERQRESNRARAEKRALVVDGLREVGRGLRKVFESRPVQVAIVALVAAAIYAAREWFR